MSVTINDLEFEAIEIQKELYPVFGYTYIFVSERYMAYIIADEQGNILYTKQVLD